MKISHSQSIFRTVLFLVLLTALLGTQFGVTPAYAASITVNSSVDTSANDGTCTLREAIANANSDSQLYASTGECAAGLGADTISFDSSLSGSTIYLASTLTLSSDMTIDGSALTSQITISGDSDNNGTGDVRVFTIGTGTTISLNSLTIAKGAFSGTPGGGGIYNPSGATLTITNSTLSGNTNTGGPGGGIRNDGTLTVTNSTFSGNTTTSSGSGGGIRNIGTLTVTNSTFSGNSTAGSGGGIYNVAGFVSVTVTNSTIAGNSASSSGGGIYTAGGTFNYANTIIANSGSGGDCATDGAIGTNINNLVEDGGCSAALSGDPALDSLANNGGPNQTFALIAGSLAIDAGDTSTCTNSPVNNLDQRGITRPVGGQCDIGAYEGSVADVSAPSLSSFTATNPSTSLSIPITAFTASDNVGVTGYLITESNTQPGQDDFGWSASAPGTYSVGNLGDFTLYPWVKDAAGNVSSVYGTPVTVNVCYSSVTVINNGDSGAGSLRQAIADTCTGGTINFYSSLAGATIHLASTLTLTKNVTMDDSALSTQITISGDNAVRVFLVNTGVTATLNSLAITNGSSFSGGGIRNDGTLTITNSTLSDNSATSGGGGIFNTGSGTLTVTNSTLSNNSAASGGGGIHNQGMLTVTNSTLSGNSDTSASGGGIYNNGGTLNYANTILANSTTGGDCVNGGTGTIGTNTNNLVEDGSCSTNSTNFLSVDPLLGSLADNGGTTQTFALLMGSPAINAGDDTICAAAPVNNLDQRGVARPQGGQCDIGAYEHQTIVTTTADPGDGTCDDTCSLHDAVATVSSGDTIVFDSSLSGGTIYLASTLNIVQNLTIDGSALASKITLSGDSDNNATGDVRVLFIHSGMTVTLDSLIITKGNGTALSDEGLTGGGGIQNNSGNNVGAGLTIINSIIHKNSATGDGGGILNTNGSTLTVINSTLSNNTATTGNGGGIYSDGTLTVTSSTIYSNWATNDGGGIRDGSITTLTNSTVVGNTASTGSGGAIYNAGSLTAKNNTLSGNSASANSGGGIYSNNTFNATNNIIANSTAGGDCAGEIDINLNNLVEDNSCTDNAVNLLSGDPGLDLIVADNGGPTQTLALSLGSIAIDAGDASTCAISPVSEVDQRGVARPVGAVCDIGAYEGAKDITAPTVTGFSATSPSSLSIPITTFTATDNVAVTGYLITETFDFPSANDIGWTVSAPSTYTVSSDGAYTLYPWVKDATGNVSTEYGSPVSVTVDSTAPTVSSITLVDSSPSAKASVQFLVTFSETVSSVDAADFSLTATVTGASVSSVSGSGTTRTVTVNSGSGDGTLRLDIPNTASITDTAGNALSGLPYTSGASYTISKTLTFTSISAQDGWVLESSETSNAGGTFNSNASTFNLGDDAAKKQYRGVLSFNTSGILDTATVTGVTLKVKQSSIVGGGNPVSIFKGFMVDIKIGSFGTTALQASDFSALANKSYGPFTLTPSSSWYSIPLTSGKAYINKLSTSSGLTQIRLRFKLDDNGNAIANYLSLFSGNAPAASRPQLVITYTIP